MTKGRVLNISVWVEGLTAAEVCRVVQDVAYSIERDEWTGRIRVDGETIGNWSIGEDDG